MRKDKIILDDKRYLIYYRFDKPKSTKRASDGRSKAKDKGGKS